MNISSILFGKNMSSTLLSLILILVSFSFGNVFKASASASTSNTGDPLFLTPFINAGKIGQARNLSLVLNLTDVISYSGFITVNSTYNSNLFFWFFPAAYNPKTAPLLIWLQGGPGGSSLFGLFAEIGPFIVDSNNNIQFRNTAWTLTHSVVFIDNPVGSGFSFTDSNEGYARNEVDVGQNLYNFMVQFYQLFPEYKANDLYITGESYAGKYIPALAYKIHKENQKLNNCSQIPLVGLALGDACTDLVSMIGWGKVLYGVGLLDENQLKVFQDQENKAKEYIAQEKWIDAWEILRSLIWDQSISYMRNVTGLNFHYNYLISEEPADYKYYVSFVQQNSVRNSLHVGSLSFNDSSEIVVYYLREDIPQSVKPWIEELLNSTKYRVLYYTGQLDVIVSHSLSLAQLNSFNWVGSNEFKSSQRKIWRIGGSNGEIAGYINETPYLSYLLVRNAGHILPYDQPKWAFDMINRFTSKKPFSA